MIVALATVWTAGLAQRPLHADVDAVSWKGIHIVPGTGQYLGKHLRRMHVECRPEAEPWPGASFTELVFRDAGDRTLSGSRYDDCGALRRLAGRAFGYYVRLFVTAGIYDTQCGMKAFDGRVARSLFPLLGEHSFTGDVELVYVALKCNLALRRVPVLLEHHGLSSVHPLRHGLRMSLVSLRIRHRYRRGKYASKRLSELSRQNYWHDREIKPARPWPRSRADDRPDAADEDRRLHR